MISDFDRTTRAQPTAISCHIQRAGIPPTLRGTVWQLLAKSKNCDLESQYITLLNEESVYEKAIVRDLARTFADHEYFQSKAGQEALFNIAKAYSLYDPDVGYCHGILYVAGPLLLNVCRQICQRTARQETLLAKSIIFCYRCPRKKHFVSWCN